MTKLTVKQQEQKRVTLTVTQNGAPLDLTGATVFLGIKRQKSDSSYLFQKEDADFNKNQEAAGIISTLFTSENLNLDPGTYVAELSLSFADADSTVDKSADIPLVIQEAVIKAAAP